MSSDVEKPLAEMNLAGVETGQAGVNPLLSLLSNPIILSHTAPYLPPSALLNLGATSQPFRDLVLHTASVFRRLDLSDVSGLQFNIPPMDNGGEIWRSMPMDEHLTEDE